MTLEGPRNTCRGGRDESCNNSKTTIGAINLLLKTSANTKFLTGGTESESTDNSRSCIAYEKHPGSNQCPPMPFGGEEASKEGGPSIGE